MSGLFVRSWRWPRWVSRGGLRSQRRYRADAPGRCTVCPAL